MNLVISVILLLLALLPSSHSQNDDRIYYTTYNSPNRYVVTTNGPPGHSKWSEGNGSFEPPGHNKWRNAGRTPPGNRDSPGLASSNPPGLNGKRPPGWNRVNIERPLENEKYEEESTYKSRSDERRPYGPDDHTSDSNRNSQNQGCRNNEFHCKSNECLPQSVRCDKRVDCRDASDEAFCIANKFGENGCILPEPPENGYYKLDDCNGCTKRPGDTVPIKSILTYSCKSNYLLSGNTISVCVDNEWSEPPSCYKVCPPLNSTSVDISCSYKQETVSCSERILPGTRATLACKSSYKLPLTNDPAYREITCLEDGLWDNRVFRCLPECGTTIARGNTLIVNGFEAQIGKFPWHVGIYAKKNTNDYEQICGGTLISSNLVVSAAHCIYDEIYNKVNNPRNYAVAAGKHQRNWNAREKYSQKSLVRSIQLGGRYMGARGNFADDIALLKLQTSFELTTFVKPICMDWDNEYEREQLQVGQVGKVVGWGKDIRGESTRNLQEIDMPFVPYQQCLSAVPLDFRGYLTSDKFCAGRLNGSSVCEGDSGGGLCFEKNGIWYLRGVVSVSPAKRGTCDYNSYVGFTYVSHFRDWIRKTYVNEQPICQNERLPPEKVLVNAFTDMVHYLRNELEPWVLAGYNSLCRTKKFDFCKYPIGNRTWDFCYLPNQLEGGHYKLDGCTDPCEINPNDTVPRNSVLTYSCKNNYVLNGNAIAICVNLTWSESPSCLKICPPLRSTSVDISICSRKGGKVSCQKVVLPGTKATLSCKPSYKISVTNDPGYREITCLDDGTWDDHIFRYLPECGLSIARGQTLIVNGYEAKVGVFPWHVGIYAKQQSEKYEQICGGTLISSGLVISAGKYFRDWNARDEYAQKSLIENIRPGERYLGQRGNFVDDIALMKLQTPFRLTTLVRPICIDWDNQYEREQLNAQQSGKIVGWGKDINGESTRSLYEIGMPFVPYQKCLSEVPVDFRGYITLDKFCGGHLNGSSVCDGDSGGGICFEKNGMWYLRGVVSVSTVRNTGCDYNSYVAFTFIANSYSWIRQIYANALRDL